MGCNHVSGKEFVYVACKDCKFNKNCDSILKDKESAMSEFCVLGNIPGGTECCDCIEDCDYRGQREPTDEELFGSVDDE